MDSFLLYRAVTILIINNNRYFGNEKRLNCEKNVVLLGKIEHIPPFFLHFVEKRRVKSYFHRLYLFPLIICYFKKSNSCIHI